MWKNVLRVMAVFFNLAMLSGCAPYPLDKCDTFPGIGACPPLPPGKEAPKHSESPQFNKYREICKSWQGRHIDELFKYWGAKFYAGARECPNKICEGYPNAVAVYSWYVEGEGYKAPDDTITDVLETLDTLDFFLSIAEGKLGKLPDVKSEEPIECRTDFAIDDKGKIIAVGPISNGDAQIHDCDELISIANNKKWLPIPRPAPGWFDDEFCGGRKGRLWKELCRKS